MVLPAIAAGVGAGVVGGILNYYAQKEQAGAIKDATATEQKALREIIQKLDSQWQLPEYQQEPLSFEETQLLQRYVPEIPQYVAERRPQLIKEAGAQQEKAAQQRALEQLQQRALSGDDAQARAAQEQALFEGRATGESLRQQALRDLAQRGLAGSGAEILSGVAAAAAGERQARQEALNIQAQQDARRQQALSQMANLASQMRGQERAVEASNVDIMNAFNQRVAQSQRAQANMKAKLRNDAQLRNIREQQRIAEDNIDRRNRAAEYNYRRAEEIEREKADLQNRKLQTIAGMQEGAANRKAITDREAGMIERTAPYRSILEGVGTAAQVGSQAYAASKGAPNLKKEGVQTGSSYTGGRK